jgi:hypothetical protein
MPNAYLPRPIVHDWSEDIGNNTADHQAALARLLRNQRRLVRWVVENAEHLDGATIGVTQYLVGVIARMFDLAGGRLKAATWEQVRDAEARVLGTLETLLPFDEGFAARVRTTAWRAQPHILDEALYSLFDRALAEGEEELDHVQAGKVFLLMWVATEVLDLNWTPPPGLELTDSADFVAVAPPAA